MVATPGSGKSQQMYGFPALLAGRSHTGRNIIRVHSDGIVRVSDRVA